MSQSRRVVEGRRKLARIAALQGRLADLRQRSAAIWQEEAEIFAELATIHAGETGEEPIDLRTQRKIRRPTATPELPESVEVSEIDRARAKRALTKNERRRRTTS